MNPFQVLGLDPHASPDQIEATYRHLLRAHHPDLHQGGSPAELAEAERRTQELNEAMALIRAGWRPQPEAAGGFVFADRPRPRDSWAPPRGSPAAGYDPPPSRSGTWSDRFQTDETTDFFGNPQRPRRAVGLGGLPAVRRGLRRRHGAAPAPGAPARPARRRLPRRPHAALADATRSDGCAGSRSPSSPSAPCCSSTWWWSTAWSHPRGPSPACGWASGSTPRPCTRPCGPAGPHERVVPDDYGSTARRRSITGAKASSWRTT